MKLPPSPPDYRPPRSLREAPAAAVSELEIQALWFEQLYLPRLATDDGRFAEVVQPGFWNHAGGPDFDRAVVRFLDANGTELSTEIGSVEVHLRPADWSAHGHDADPAYARTILHVVWEAPGRRAFFPATSEFRRVPQVVLGNQLIGPWLELRGLVGSLAQRPLPGAVPGRCSSALAALPGEEIVEILRAAGQFRLRQKAQRIYWRGRAAGAEQALFEALAEALGFHANQIPMRLVAQRLPWKRLKSLSPPARLAHLFGLGGFLPAESLARLESEPRVWLRELWEIWWPERAPLEYALLTKADWRLAGLRPLNRPERRLAALAHIVPLVSNLLEAVRAADSDRFAAQLLEVRDPFWERQATLESRPLAAPTRLIGEERARDMLINIFWPLVALQDPERAREGLRQISAASNGAAQIATQRMLLSALTPKQMREALVQQGLLQVFRDYCQTDCSQCRDCTFPEVVKSWRPVHSAAEKI